jgi:hypothetical protein
MSAMPKWWAKGLLFENCNCRVVCPGHVHFDQLCTFDRCVGYWAIHFEAGEFDGVSLGELNAVVIYDTPQHMISGNWTEAILIDQGASAAQREKIEAILSGKAGGPWEVLARFVARRLATRFVPIQIEDLGKTKRVMIDGLLESSVEAIRGRDKSRTVTFENMFNQIHAPSQVIARGGTRYDDGEIQIKNDQSHALYSNFDWSVS